MRVYVGHALIARDTCTLRMRDIALSCSTWIDSNIKKARSAFCQRKRPFPSLKGYSTLDSKGIECCIMPILMYMAQSRGY